MRKMVMVVAVFVGLAGCGKDSEEAAAPAPTPPIRPIAKPATKPIAKAVKKGPEPIKFINRFVADEPDSKKGKAQATSVDLAVRAVAAECGHLPLWFGATVAFEGYLDNKVKTVKVSVDAVDKRNIRDNILWYNVRLDRKGRPDGIKPMKQVSADACFYKSVDDYTPIGHIGHQLPDAE